MDAVHVILLVLLGWKYKTKIALSSFFIVQSKIVVKLLFYLLNLMKMVMKSVFTQLWAVTKLWDFYWLLQRL